MKVSVFCSANDLDKKYVEPTKELGALLAKAGHTLMWGGADLGLMKVIADGVQNNGGEIIGVTTERFLDFARKNANEMIVTKDLNEWKAVRMERSDVIVVLPGGLGTFDEITEAIEYKRQGMHTSNIIVFNVAGFYDGLKAQLQHMADEGFLPVDESGKDRDNTGLDRWVRFIDTPLEVMSIIG